MLFSYYKQWVDCVQDINLGLEFWDKGSELELWDEGLRQFNYNYN